MPELPEVETTRRGIAPFVVGQTIAQLQVRERRLRWPVPDELEQLLQGQAVISLQRRAKYLLFETANGYFMLHLGMSGSLRIVSVGEEPGKHDHVDFVLGNDKVLRFNDPRRFGSLLWLGHEFGEHSLLQSLGPEPLGEEFSGEHLFRQSRKRKAAVKNFIMDNHVVVGVGNIYASEALFASGIRPGKAAGRVTRKQYDLLAAAIVDVLSTSIQSGGTTLRDFVGGDGKPGYFQQRLRVYGRDGEPCRECGSIVRLKRLGQRSSFYCPACQQ